LLGHGDAIKKEGSWLEWTWKDGQRKEWIVTPDQTKGDESEAGQGVKMQRRTRTVRNPYLSIHIAVFLNNVS
jgi:hypothetical protein